jgi:hypothetical protein
MYSWLFLMSSIVQAAVAALLSKAGGPGRRRRERTGAAVEAPIESAIHMSRPQPQVVVAPESDPFPALALARKVLELSTAVADVADEVRSADNSLETSVGMDTPYIETKCLYLNILFNGMAR